jgi:hypothetical protein
MLLVRTTVNMRETSLGERSAAVQYNSLAVTVVDLRLPAFAAGHDQRIPCLTGSVFDMSYRW